MGGSVSLPGHAVTVKARNNSGPVPDILRTKFVWSLETLQATGPSFQQQLAFNNLLDPNQTGSGAPVPYFDTFSRMFQNWRVYAAGITVYIDALNTATQEAYVFLYPVSSVTSMTLPLNVNEGMQFPNSKYVVVGTDTSLRDHKELKHYCETGALDGVVNIADQSGYSGDFYTPPSFNTGASSPGIENFFVIQIIPSTPGAGLDYQIRAKLEFYAELYNVQPATQIPALPPMIDCTTTDDIMSDSVIIQKVKDALGKAKPVFT